MEFYQFLYDFLEFIIFQQDFSEYFRRKSRNELSDSGMDLLQRLLTYDPARRITASCALNHPYLHT
ncbi:hypothetical protein MANES_10G002357v8 [Manihot esculenta]|uniref:Uncharacterized protein n=1 Tax=Manihot esculenta TaxID=3983 RepID=A0ACB7GXF5_MANES|nr:hypothetical protein MANES_10G002357v8 [Manihot esculenta]